jgi:hypothetical protein
MPFGHDKLDVYPAAIETAKRRAGIDAGRLKSHVARRWSALRFRTCSLVCDALSADDNSKQKALLDGIVAMPTKLGQRGYAVSEELGGIGLVSSIPTPIPITDTDADSGSE